MFSGLSRGHSTLLPSSDGNVKRGNLEKRFPQIHQPRSYLAGGFSHVSTMENCLAFPRPWKRGKKSRSFPRRGFWDSLEWSRPPRQPVTQLTVCVLCVCVCDMPHNSVPCSALWFCGPQPCCTLPLHELHTLSRG